MIRRWTVDRILAEMRRLARRGVAITNPGLGAACHDLAGAIRHHLGSIIRARRLARLPEPVVTRRQQEVWDDERVIEEILELERTGASLASSKVDSRLVT